MAPVFLLPFLLAEGVLPLCFRLPLLFCTLAAGSLSFCLLEL